MAVRRRAILIFTREPVAGRAKTRLGRALGGKRAASLAGRMLERTLEHACAVPGARVQLWCHPSTRHPLFRRLGERYGARLYPQRGADLGERMGSALGHALTGPGTALLVGGDCPLLRSREYQRAFSWLESGEDAVLGPAADGGYVLLGLREPDADLFKAMPWGTAAVAELTRMRFRANGWSWRELPSLPDIDRPCDLRHIRGLRLSPGYVAGRPAPG